MSRFQANCLLLLAGAVWGMGFVAQQTAMQDIGPYLFIALRFLIATLVVLPFALRETLKSDSHLKPVTLRDLLLFVLVGISLFVGMAFQQVGLLSTTVTNSGFLTGLYVVFTPFLSILIFREWPNYIVWPAAVLALLGIGLLSGSGLSGLNKGDLLTLCSAVAWALQVVLIARFVVQSGRPLLLSTVQFGVTASLAFVGVFIMQEAIVWEHIKAAGTELLYTGIFASGLAFTLQVIGQRYTTASQAAIFLSSEAPFAALFGAIFVGERIALIGLAGCVLILGAMLLVELGPQYLTKGRHAIKQ
jgi:drug/metabolite transporter (DMT)-like permease